MTRILRVRGAAEAAAALLALAATLVLEAAALAELLVSVAMAAAAARYSWTAVTGCGPRLRRAMTGTGIAVTDARPTA